jgi:hypothetical protein
VKAETATLPETDVWIADESERCEDCPDVNPNPPSSSDCPHFEVTIGGPTCDKQSELQRWLGGGGGAGTGVADTVHMRACLVCPLMVEVERVAEDIV